MKQNWFLTSMKHILASMPDVELSRIGNLSEKLRATRLDKAGITLLRETAGSTTVSNSKAWVPDAQSNNSANKRQRFKAVSNAAKSASFN
jgi:hypothetical protein